jgi:NAD(P)H-dependent FMN reductase
MIILGSSRQGRQGEKVAKWVTDYVSKQPGVEVDFVDVKDLGLTYFDEAASVGYLGGNYKHPKAKAWADRVAKADGFVIVTPEYNHGITAALKDAIDYVWESWHYKPVSFVSYSMAPWGGVRAVEQLRLTMLGVKAFPLYEATHIGAVHETVSDLGEIEQESPNNSLQKTTEELVSVVNMLTK